MTISKLMIITLAITILLGFLAVDRVSTVRGAEGNDVAYPALTAADVPAPRPDACDHQRLAVLETDFKQAATAYDNTPSAAMKQAYQTAALDYMTYAAGCVQAHPDGAGETLPGDTSIDNGGLLAPGGLTAQFYTQGRKWGAGSPYTPSGSNTPGPGIAGGTVSYSFMSDGVTDGTGSRFYPETITAISSLPGYQACFLEDIRTAFAAWAAVADIDLVEVTDNGLPFDDPAAGGDIRIGAHPMDGLYKTIAQAFFPPPNGNSAAGDIFFDVDDPWGCQPTNEAYDIGLVALHEIGHSLGLHHESVEPSIMRPSYGLLVGLGTLQQDDINGLQSIYGTTGATAVTLIAFSATPGPEGVTLAWETGPEIDNAGFNLYRATSPVGPWTHLNAGLIPAQGDAVSGASYSFVDTAASGEVIYYRLEDISLDGHSTFYGPIVPATAQIFLPVVVR